MTLGLLFYNMESSASRSSFFFLYYALDYYPELILSGDNGARIYIHSEHGSTESVPRSAFLI